MSVRFHKILIVWAGIVGVPNGFGTIARATGDTATVEEGNASKNEAPPQPDMGALKKLIAETMMGKSPLVGKAAPDFTLKTFDGQTSMTLSAWKGKKTVLLNFFATWCGPCKQEFPGMVNVYEEYKSQDVEFISIDVGENKGADPQALLPPFVKQYGLVWPVVMDEEHRVTKAYGVGPIPTNVIVDRDGIVRWYQAGGLPEHMFRTQLNRVLRSSKADPVKKKP